MLMPKSGLQERLKSLSFQGGADLFGIADITPAREFIASQGNDLDRLPRAISIGMQLCNDIVDRHSPDEKREESFYWHHVYGVVSPLLDLLAQRVCRELQMQGSRAFPVPASMPYDRERLSGVFSHKLAAHLAGLGWIGKSCLLLTEEFGPRVRFVTVLTDADLTPGEPFDKKCGKCRVCVVSCPAQAITGREFRAADPREDRLDARACADYRQAHPCGLCVARCPTGDWRRRSKSK
jgi:epoxyqueuosine reductase